MEEGERDWRFVNQSQSLIENSENATYPPTKSFWY